ncbi:hypothetical protein [Burkholderia ubonensis]|uniref:hypothetical protein n=1 Tax=Burkholderia ubonensis TaxID=101571 RepID=UPI000B157104|nr:hypothetical protein [Burkholderia ubonensis]
MRIQFDNDAVARASAKRLVALLEDARDERYIGPLKLGQAQQLTAMVLGYASWQELRKVLGTASPSLLDEELGPAELKERLEAQVSRLRQAFSVPSDVATEFISIWRPSMGPAAYNSTHAEEEVDDDFSGIDAFRLSHPSDVDFGVDLCRGLNWPILSAGDDPEFGMASVITYGSRPDRPVPIFVSALAYVPGDEGDDQAAQQRRSVAHFIDAFPAAPGACIIYQHPMLSGGFVFAGAVYRNRTWLDMAWSSALTSIDTLFAWADNGWSIQARHPETADKDGKMSALVKQCMQNSYERMLSAQ